MLKVLTAAIVLTAMWALMDRIFDPVFGWRDTDLWVAFWAALGGAGMIRLSNQTAKS